MLQQTSLWYNIAMSAVILQKNYKKLENRLESLEQIIKEFFAGELQEAKIKKLDKISRQLDEGGGRRFASHREFQRYLKSL